MTERQPPRRYFAMPRGAEGDRVTTLELFFDLVFVFAFIQITTLMAYHDPPLAIVQGVILLSLLWFAWSALAWLANQAPPTTVVLRVAFVLATCAMFLAALVLPDVFDEPGNGLSAPVVLVVCYGVVRMVHAIMYLMAAHQDSVLRRQVQIIVTSSVIPTMTLLAVGAALGGSAQVWVWLAAVLYDFVAVFVAGLRVHGWHIQSVEHFSERHGLIVILAIGESIIAIGMGLEDVRLDGVTAAGALLSILLAVALWSAYFGRVAGVLENALHARPDSERAAVGQDAFTYLHFPVIAGIIFGALGIKLAMENVGEAEIGATAGWYLAGGVALFLLGTVGAIARSTGRWWRLRILAAFTLVAVAPLLGSASSIIAVASVTTIVLALTVAERTGGAPAT